MIGGMMGSLTGGGGMSASSSASASQGGDYYGGNPLTMEGMHIGSASAGMSMGQVAIIGAAVVAAIYLLNR